jgi:hypothetical protein
VIAYVDKTFLVCDRVFGYSSIVLLEVYILPVRVYLPNWDAPATDRNPAQKAKTSRNKLRRERAKSAKS